MTFLVRCLATFLMATLGALLVGVPLLLVVVVVMAVSGVDESDEAGVVKNVFELQVGECFDVDTSALPAVASVACSELHDMEAFALLDLDVLPLTPGPAIRDVCRQMFPDFAGIALEDSVLEVDAWVPTGTDYAGGFRIVPCFVRHSDGIKLQGSMANARL